MRYIIRKSKKESWQTFVSNINSSTPASTVNIYASKQKTDPPFYERIHRYLAEFQLTFPQTFSNNILTPPPWIINLPEINRNLLQYNKNETNPLLIIQKFNEIMENQQGFYEVYTDASKTEDGATAAFMSPNYSTAYKLNKTCSIYHGELMAILKALEYIKTIEQQNIIIISDSLSALSSLSQIFLNNPILLSIKTVLYNLQLQHKTVKVLWIPSHIGIKGNEDVDKLARGSIGDDTIPTIQEIVHTDYKKTVKDSIIREWQSQWNNSQSKLFQVNKHVTPWKSNPASRNHQIILYKLRIDHTRITHSYLLSIRNPPTCEVCQSQLSIQHILEECPTYNNQ